MNLSLYRPWFAFAFVALAFLSLFFITQISAFQTTTSSLSLGITADVVLTIPLIYWLLIRKTRIPNITVVPVLLLGVLGASALLPESEQSYLRMVRNWVIPVVELGVLSFVGFKVYKATRTFSEIGAQEADFFTALQQTCQKLVPGRVANLLAMEIAVLYYGFLNWKKPRQASNTFSYHKKSSASAILLLLIIMVGVETFAIHILVAKWSHTAAWILSAISIYTGFQLLGFARSLRQRPVVLEQDKLLLRYGILSQAELDLSNIASVELFRKPIEKGDGILKLSPLGELDAHNLLIKLHEPVRVQGLYGMKKTASQIALYIDEKDNFKALLEQGKTERSM